MSSRRWREDASPNLVMLAVGKTLAAVRDRGTWMQLALLTDTRDEIEGHRRLLRALAFGDDDYEGAVYHVLPFVLGDLTPPGMEPPPFGKPLTAEERFKHLTTVTDHLRVFDWLAENDPALAAQIVVDDQADTLLPDGTVLNAVEATAGRLGVAEMRRQVDRIRRDHGQDSEALIGHVRDRSSRPARRSSASPVITTRRMAFPHSSTRR